MRNHPDFRAYVALAAVCFFWGTTYLGIRMALESFPPMVLVSSRYVISGGIMLAAALWRGDHLPRGKELLVTCFTGLLTLGIGNGTLVLAETHIASGIAGLIITISPFWLVGIEALLPGGAPLHFPTILGMLVGLGGAALLFTPDLQSHAMDHSLIAGFLLLQLGMVGWSSGSIIQRRLTSKAHPVIAGAVQQLFAGLALVPIALVAHEQPIVWSARGTGALLYLVFFGSIVGYSAYAYALDRLPVAVVSIYPYVNAVVAIALGWLFYREPFGWKETAAMLVIFAGVGIVKTSAARAKPRR